MERLGTGFRQRQRADFLRISAIFHIKNKRLSRQRRCCTATEY